MKDVTGIERGKCNSCPCTEYRIQAGSGGLRCDYCNHTPAEHAKVTTQLGACLTCGKDTCDKYVPEDGHSTGECQYCGCDANSHAGGAAAACEKYQKYTITESAFSKRSMAICTLSINLYTLI